ncbi:MAG: tetratricopeptide repeat protein [Elusimicrobia bacterium]|nr:tetratricopeptide repeat protein [Elusimicrobiota bacterium]
MYEKIEKLILNGSYDRALTAAEKIKAYDRKTSYKYLIWIYRMKGKPDKALNFLKKLERNADNLCEEAVLLRMKCDFKKARGKINQAIKIYRNQKDNEGLAFAYWARGGIERYGGQPRRGYNSFRKSLELSKGAVPKAYSLCGLGGTGRLLGKIGESLKNYWEANKIFEKRKDVFGIAYSFCGTASAYRMKENFEKSAKLYRKAIDLYEKIKDDWNRAYSMWGLAQTEWFRKKRKEAEKINAKAEKIFLKFRDPRGKFYCLLQKANFERMAGNFEKAEKILKNSSGIPEKLGLPYEKKLLEMMKEFLQKKETKNFLLP